MDKIEFQSIVRGEIESAVNFHDSEYSAERIQALDYYLGKPLGNEVEGRSQVVQTEISDVVESIMPSLMKIFGSGDDFVKFEPRSAEDVEGAKQATDYVNFILNSDNNGFVLLHNWFKDSLLFKMGILKTVFLESEKVTEDLYEGLSEDELTLLLMDEDIEVVEQEAIEIGAPLTSPDGQIMPAPMAYDVRVRKTQRDGRIKIENIPPEEFIFSQRAKTLEDARFVAHRTEMTVSDLIEMGYDRETVEGHAGSVDADMMNEKQSRFEDFESRALDAAADMSQRDVLVTEAYMKVDYDGDGKSEIRRVVCLGEASEIVENEPYHMFPFAILSPILMPHRMVGRSIAELLIDLTQAKTAVVRQILDNIYMTNQAKIGAVEGQVNLDDLIANRPGGIVRMRAPGMVQPLTPPSVAGAAFPLLAYLEDMKETRTGISKASLGLDPDALQSSTATAVAATVTAAQSKVEMIARVFAETGVKHLMLCILQLVQKHQQQPRIIRLRNEFVPMDPANWDVEFDVVVNVGLGHGDERQRGAALAQVSAQQKEILVQLGQDNPLTTLGQFRNTLVKMLGMAGFKNGSDFFLDPDNLPPEVQQKIAQKQQMQQQQGAGNSEQQKLQLEKMKAEAEIQLDREKMNAELQLKRDEIKMKFELRKQEMEYEAQLRGLEAVQGGNISTNMPRQ